MPAHILVVGGTGMLSELVEALAGDGGRLSLLSRRASQAFGGAGFDCDYHDQQAFSAALAAAVERSGPVDLAIAWFHTLKIAAPRLLAEQVRGRLFQVLGSATADPAHQALGARGGGRRRSCRVPAATGRPGVQGRRRRLAVADQHRDFERRTGRSRQRPASDDHRAGRALVG